MKSIIETSVYLIVLVFSCMLFIGFIGMNRSISCVDEMTSYIQDYIEVHGSSIENESGGYDLDADTINFIKEKAAQKGMSVTCEYDTQTHANAYYIVHVTYTLSMPVLHILKTHTYDAYARALKST